MFLVVSCKMENEQSNSPTPKIQEVRQNQIEINSNDYNSEDVREFVEEIQFKQQQNKDTIFEIVQKNSIQNGSTIVSRLKDNHLYANKNFYIFIGLGNSELDASIQKTDWNAIYLIMNYVSKLNFRVMINVKARTEHLKLAAEDSETAVILWSSHGNTKYFMDAEGKAVPTDIFEKKHSNFYQFILSSCEGRVALDEQYNIKKLRTWAWRGTTTSTELGSFLVSDDWSALDGKNLSSPVKGYTCTASGTSFAVMNVENRFKNDERFSTLDECKTELKNL